MGAGFVGILSVELHFPEAGSLKGKRKFVQSAKAQLQNRFGASVAEVDHHDRWQRAKLTVACVAREHREVEDLLHDVFIEAWRRAKDYDATRGTVRAWLVMRMRSRALDRVTVRPASFRDINHYG